MINDNICLIIVIISPIIAILIGYGLTALAWKLGITSARKEIQKERKH